MWWRYREEISREMYLREGPSITLYANNDIWKKREIIIVMMMTNCRSSNALTSNIIFGDSWEDHHLSLLGCTVLHKWLIIKKKKKKKKEAVWEVQRSVWAAESLMWVNNLWLRLQLETETHLDPPHTCHSRILQMTGFKPKCLRRQKPEPTLQVQGHWIFLKKKAKVFLHLVIISPLSPVSFLTPTKPLPALCSQTFSFSPDSWNPIIRFDFRGG